jgi:hypothetical protein
MSTNPFNIRTVLLTNDSQHVVLIHFPIALFMVAVVFDYLAQWTNNRTLAAAAYFNLLVAAVSTVPVNPADRLCRSESRAIRSNLNSSRNCCGARCSGFPIHPDLFARANVRLFC